MSRWPQRPPAQDSETGASVVEFALIPLRDGQKLVANGRLGHCVDPRVKAAPATGALDIGAKLREGHDFQLLRSPVLGASSSITGSLVGISHRVERLNGPC